MSLVTSISSSGGMEPDQTVIRVYLVNGESRSLRVDERTDVTVSHCAVHWAWGARLLSARSFVYLLLLSDEQLT